MTAMKSSSDQTNIVFADPRNENQALRSNAHHIVNAEHILNSRTEGKFFDLIKT